MARPLGCAIPGLSNLSPGLTGLVTHVSPNPACDLTGGIILAALLAATQQTWLNTGQEVLPARGQCRAAYLKPQATPIPEHI